MAQNQGDLRPGAWRASGAFSGWDPNGGVELAPVPGSDFSIGSATIPRGQSYEYKLVHDGRFVEDPLAKNVRWDGIDRGYGVRGEMNAIVHPADLPSGQGRTVAFGKIENRSVWVHYPATYDSSDCKKLPSIVIHDGMESLTRGGFAEVADQLYAERPDLSAILVFGDVTRAHPRKRRAARLVLLARPPPRNAHALPGRPDRLRLAENRQAAADDHESHTEDAEGHARVRHRRPMKQVACRPFSREKTRNRRWNPFATGVNW